MVLNNLTAWAFTTGRVYLKGDGSAWRPIVLMGGMAGAFLAIVNAPRVGVRSQAVNVGRTAENYTIRELAEIVAETVPGSRVEYADGASADKRNYRVNCDKIIDTLPDFKPVWTARKGAQELYEAYQAVGFEVDEFEGPRYRRIHHIKQLIERNDLDINLRWQKPVPA
jgi:nucleoside-diphosphate-sugar epimerase